jgi:excisionase family DNA binding protein
VQDAGQDDRVTVAEAAERLRITKEAVRKRISRGSLRADKDQDGTVRVYVPASGTAAATFDRDELIAGLRARIEDLRTDRDAWRDQARRSDYMASAALDRTRELEGRLRELEAPSDERKSPSEATEQPGSAERTREKTRLRECRRAVCLLR